MQKRNWFFIGLLLFGMKATLSAQTLNFHKGSIKEAMAKGKQQNKLVFVDFFTDWCAPCKVMDRDVFTDPKVVGYFNKNFISVKLDAEKGEGIGFASKNRVNAYPTFIIFNPDEKAELRLVGAYQANVFLEKVQKGLDNKRSPEALAERYQSGERTPALVNDYAFSLLEKGNEKEGFEVVSDYFKSLSKRKLRSPSNWFLFERYTPNMFDEKARFLFENKKYISKKIGTEKVDNRMNALLHSTLLTYLSGYQFRSGTFDEATYSGLKKTIERADLPASFGYAAAVSIADAQVEKNYDRYLDLLESDFGQLQKSARFVIMVNMGSNLADAGEKLKSRAADFLEKYMGELTDKISSNAIRKVILNFRNEEEYTSVNFEKGDFNSVLSKAKAQDKLIFFDAYADWCGPCKVMDETVFADPIAGKFFNTNFVNAKVDMEKGEGPELQKSYPVSAFPTYLLIDKNGQEIHRIVGAYETTQFMELVRNGSKPNNGLSYLKAEYAKGSRETDLLKSLSEALFFSYQKGELNKNLNAYFESQTEESKMDQNNLFMYKYSSGIADKKFQYFLEKADQFKKQWGEKTFFSVVDHVAEPGLMNEQVHFKKKDYSRNKFPQLYALDLPKESQVKLLMDLIDIAGEGPDNINELLAFHKENVLNFTNERTRLMTLYLLLGVPNNGTTEQKVQLRSLLKEVIGKSKNVTIKKSLEMFLNNLEGKMEDKKL